MQSDVVVPPWVSITRALQLTKPFGPAVRSLGVFQMSRWGVPRGR